MSLAGRLAGKLAFVTGAGSGIGKAVCDLFATEGAQVAAADLNTKALQAAYSESKGISTFSCDIGNEDSLASALQGAIDNFGQVPTIAVNCAGITRDAFLLKMNPKLFDEVINVNLKGSFLLTQQLGRALVEAKQPGSIVHISSVVAKNGNVGQANYVSSKAGVIGLTKTSANELSRYDIRVNCVLPGFIETPMTDQVPDKIKAMVIDMIPLKRMGQPEEIAKVCLFLSSDDSSYVTGAAIEATGGFYV